MVNLYAIDIQTRKRVLRNWLVFLRRNHAGDFVFENLAGDLKSGLGYDDLSVSAYLEHTLIPGSGLRAFYSGDAAELFYFNVNMGAALGSTLGFWLGTGSGYRAFGGLTSAAFSGRARTLPGALQLLFIYETAAGIGTRDYERVPMVRFMFDPLVDEYFDYYGGLEGSFEYNY